MCEFLRIDLTDDQRKAFNSMYAKLVLYRIGKTRKDKNENLIKGPEKKQLETKHFFYDPNDIKSFSADYDYKKDWTFPVCCNQYFGENKTVLFNDFLEEVAEL